MFFHSIKSKKSLLPTILACFLLLGCGPKKDEIEKGIENKPAIADTSKIFTGRVYTQVEVINLVGYGYFGKSSYAEVNREWVLSHYMDYRMFLSKKPLTVLRWDNKAECTFFATGYELFAQGNFKADSFQSWINTPSIAVGTIWYKLNANEYHAVNIMITARGAEFFEPQTGKFIELSVLEKSQPLLIKFD